MELGAGERGMGSPRAWAFLSSRCQAAGPGLCLTEPEASQAHPGPPGKPQESQRMGKDWSAQ